MCNPSEGDLDFSFFPKTKGVESESEKATKFSEFGLVNVIHNRQS